MNSEHAPQEKESILQEIAYYVRTEKKYWIIPLIVIFIIFGTLLIIAQTVPVISPFIYRLF